MNSRERVIKTLKFEEVDRFPRHLWALDGIKMFQKAEYEEVLSRFEMDFDIPICSYGKGKKCKGNASAVGMYTDAWGCVWHVGEPGVSGEVKEYPLADWADLNRYELPWELLNEAQLSKISESYEASDKFIIVGSETRPFERMQFLRGTENVLMDLAYGEKEVYQLRDMLHDFYIKDLQMWSNTDIDGVVMMDDWGSQNSLLISPTMWREFFKPLYKDYCDILHSKGKYALFHSDGNIESIYPDLIEVGFDAINSQLFCMDIERIGEKHAGKVAFWGEIDRQHILTNGSTDDVRAGVRRVANAMIKDGKRTGIIAQCEWGMGHPKENIEAVFDEWSKV